jgi:hypothetical protein
MDIVDRRRLPTVLDLADLRRMPAGQPPEITTAQARVKTEFAQLRAEGFKCLLSTGRR